MSNPLRRKRGNALVFALLGLLILGLGGFGVTNFSGSVRSVGAVGDTQIDINDYARALNNEMRAMSAQLGQPVDFALAQTLGIDRKAQAALLAAAALDNEAARTGLSAGDAEVGRRILAVAAFQGVDGTFSRETYRLTLQQEGLSEAEFEAKLRAEAGRGILQAAVVGGIDATPGFVRTLTAYIGETRDFTLAELLPADLPEPVPAPSDADLKAQYDATPEAYTRPETRRLTTIWLSPETRAETVEVDEQAVRDAYQARIAEFVIPEKRLVSRLVFATADEAAAAKARIDAGTATIEDIAGERGLTAADIDLGEAGREDLGAAAEAVFALAGPGIAGPIDTDLGPALFAVNAVLAAEETPFEDVREDLAQELRLDRARRLIADETSAIEDDLASGASLEDIARDHGMELGTMAYNATTEGGLAGYAEFRAAADAVTADDFPALVALEDGGAFALRLDGIDAPTLKPIDEVREQVVADWTLAETFRRLSALAGEIAAQVDNGATLEGLGLVTTRYEGFARGGFIADAPEAVAEAVFATATGKAAVVAETPKVFVLALQGVTPVDAAADDTKTLSDTVRAQAAQGLAQDAFELFVTALQAEAGLSLDQAALNAVHAQMQ
jgi:peptidyl-prolyl cis-trans isomerase D